MTEDNKKECGYCKHFAQGKTCSFCANEKQTNRSLQEYLYYNFTCNLFEEGIHQSRVDYMKNKK